jgi:hypothetical protein
LRGPRKQIFNHKYTEKIAVPQNTIKRLRPRKVLIEIRKEQR